MAAVSGAFVVSQPSLSSRQHHSPTMLGIRAFPMSNKKTTGGLIRCEVSSSTVSALQQLKKSSIDRYTKERSSIVVIGLSVHTH